MDSIRNMIRKALNLLGYDIRRLDPEARSSGGLSREEFDRLFQRYQSIFRTQGIDKAHYGCGDRLFGDGWANIDLRPPASADKLVLEADLIGPHPFPSDFFRYAFAEDFIEHLAQDDSIVFLCEAYRCLRPGGVLRLSFPGLRGVLRCHYTQSDYEGAVSANSVAYATWGHRHFYCEESLQAVALHIGFTEVKFVRYGESVHSALRNLESRPNQQDINIHAELTKQEGALADPA